jgi:hypothetical protein
VRDTAGSVRGSDCQAEPSPADARDRSHDASVLLGQRVDRQAPGQAGSADMREGMLAGFVIKVRRILRVISSLIAAIVRSDSGLPVVLRSGRRPSPPATTRDVGRSVDNHRAHRLTLPCSMCDGDPEDVPAQLPCRGWDRHDFHQVCARLRLNDPRDSHVAATWANNYRIHAEVCGVQTVSRSTVAVRDRHNYIERKLVARLSDAGGCASAPGRLSFNY